MKRKLLLLIGSFILLLLAFGTYQLFVPGIAMFDPAGGMRLRPAALTFEPGKGPGIGRSEDVTFYYRNPDGQLRGVYHVAAWTKDDDGSFVLEQPEAVVYQRDGTRVYMTAERGRIWAEEVSGGKGFNVRNGTMDGQVEIFYDQSRDEDYGDEERPHPKDRPYDEMLRDVLRVTTTDVEFSRDLLELTTDGNVTIWSRQLDMTGQGLCLRWNEEPRELRLLRIEKGGVMVVKELPEEVNLTQLPTPQEQPSPTTQPETKPATAPATAPAGDWGLVEDRVAQSEPSPPPAVEEEPEATNVVVVMTQPRATTGPAQTQPTFGERKMMNIYQATFYTDVRLFSGDRRMTGAETLGMIFEWDRQWEGREDRPSPAKRPAASQPTTKPKFASARTQPGRRTLDAEAAQASDRQMVLYWDGSLEIVPQGRTETPSRDRVTITGQGEDVSLSDADARLLCKRFWFQNPQQEAWFEGDEKTPARVQLARGDEITCHGRIRFIRSLGKAFLEGPGEMVRYAREEDFAGWGTVPLGPDDSRLILDRVTWGQKVEAGFGERKVSTRSGRKETRPYITEANFFENVKMVQFVSPTPRRQAGAVRSYIEANDTLHVWMGLNEAGKSYPSKALARGKVSALQQGSKIAADEVTVTFQPAAGDEAETETAPAASEVLAGMGGKVDPITFHASGAVDIKYVETKRPDEPPLCVQADLVDADLASELAVLMGAPAKIWRGTDRIEGEVIHFDRNAEAAKVTGKGSLRFYTKQDLSGNTLSTPRPVRVAWSNWMLYHGQAGQCVFDGEVDLASAGEKMHCPKQMRLFFEPRKRDESGSTQQGIPRGARSLAMGVDDFSGARFSRIEADGGSDESQWVRMQTQRAHPQNDTWVLQRMQVRGRQVLYDDTEGFAYVNGPGDFLAEDYRLPRETDRRRREEYANVMGGQIDRPSQTLFRWKQAMYLDQNNRNVSLREGVEMIHRSGNKMISLPNLNTQPFGRLEDGRISTLRSELLDAWFEPPAAEVPVRDESGRIKDTKRRPSVDLLQGGPEFGELRKFSATGDVSMKMADDGFGYGTTLIDGQRVLYDGIRQIINVWGYREGASKRMDAQITIEDRRAGVPPKTVNSPMLIYDLKNDVIKVETVRGGGGM